MKSYSTLALGAILRISVWSGKAQEDPESFVRVNQNWWCNYTNQVWYFDVSKPTNADTGFGPIFQRPLGYVRECLRNERMSKKEIEKMLFDSQDALNALSSIEV